MFKISPKLGGSIIRRFLATSSSGSHLPASLSKYPIGLNIHGYEIEDVKPIPEYSIVAVKLKHKRTGSEHLHLDSQIDKNNVFSIGFKTNPPDKTGVPHILEHTTLCGSHKYPVKDPFFKMLNRSLSNFMNAMTGHDYTFYPFATTNSKDFDNLMDVYLSSVFEPLLTHEDFTQEGWRLEHEELTNKDSPIVYKGVVYNEMKGQYSNSAYLFWIAFQEAIYPSLNNSGGNPENIVDLNYEDLVDFHAKNYHPSNAKTYTYGNLPLFNHLRKLDAALNLFGKRGIRYDVKKSIFSEPEFNQRVVVKGPIDPLTEKPLSKQYKSSVSWNLGNPLEETNQYEIFKWKVLSSLLCDGHNSPFYQELIEKGYGDDFSINTGLDATTALLTFNLGLNNISLEQVESLESKMLDIFHSKVIPEFSKENSSFNSRIEAILHQIELNFKKHKPDFGLGLLNSLLPTWVNGLDPIVTLQIEEILSRFKEDYSREGLKMFQDMIESKILNNNQKFYFTMEPSEAFNDDIINLEKESLKNKLENLTEEDSEIIFRRGQHLAKKQESEEDVSVLPTLTLKDISRKGDFFELSFSDINSSNLQRRVVDTNGLVYATAAKNLAFLPNRLYPYLPLFTSCLTNLAGTNETSVTDLETKIQSLTGGLSFNVNALTNPYDIGDPRLMFVMSGMALQEKAENVYNLWKEILTQTNFDKDDAQVLDKLTTLIKNLNQNQMNIIAERGHSYAMSNSNSHLTPTKHINDILGGIAQTKFILSLGASVEKRGNEFLAKEVLPVLNEIKEAILTNNNFRYSLVCDADAMQKNENLVEKFDSSFSSDSKLSEVNDFTSKFQRSGKSTQNTLIDLPFQVGYASLSKLGSPYVTKDGASLQVLSQLLTYKHLHSLIRESNGAYGGGLNYDGLGGTLSFYSYRDPNPLKSVDSFEKSLEIAVGKTGEWDSQDLQEAKLSIFQSIDAPSHVASQGSSNFLEGITDEMRQKRREDFLDVTTQDLQDVVNKYLVTEKSKSVTVIGNNDLLGVDPSPNSSWKIEHLDA